MTRPYAEVIGDPIAHSKSPLIHNFWLGKLGIDAEYRACHVRPEELADYFARRRGDAAWRGCNVTIPHKEAALRFVEPFDRLPTEIGAINTVSRSRNPERPGVLLGDNTDVDGVLAAIDSAGWQRDAGISCIVGAGGAAKAAIYALGLAQASELRIVARRREQGQALLAKSGLPGGVYDFEDCGVAFHGAETVINASPLGMIGKSAMPGQALEALESTTPEALVFDMVYVPLETEFLAKARNLGRSARDGLLMLVAQADTAFCEIFGPSPPREHDAELRALLIA